MIKIDKIKALLIDNCIKFCQTFDTLAANTIDLEIAHSGTEGLNCLTKSPPHFVLLYLKLGRGINGLEVLKRIKKSHPDLPVFMITDFANVPTAAI